MTSTLTHLNTKLRPLALPTLAIMSTLIFFNDHILEPTRITGSSMSPTLSPNFSTTGAKDSMLWRKWNATSNIQRGDVVHFANPTKPESLAVKRVIALEGDVVHLDPRRRPANNDGREAPEARSWDAWDGKATVPQGHVWVEGDNWRCSRDSNWYGPISRSLINGRAARVLTPGSRFWGRPWEGYEIRTRVVKGGGGEMGD